MMLNHQMSVKGYWTKGELCQMLYWNLNRDIVFVLQELRGASARELEACRRELEEGSSRQRQHFLEEVELLKVQSEERLQDRINQLKVKKTKHLLL